jgi:hypothetical protein
MCQAVAYRRARVASISRPDYEPCCRIGEGGQQADDGNAGEDYFALCHRGWCAKGATLEWIRGELGDFTLSLCDDCFHFQSPWFQRKPTPAYGVRLSGDNALFARKSIRQDRIAQFVSKLSRF